MPFDYTCPQCGETSKDISDEFRGTKGTCRSCGKAIFMPSRGSRSKSSCILIVIVVIGIPTLLLIPVFMAGFEASRRMTCASHLKSIGLALHNYHDSYRSLPPAYTVDGEGKRLHSWRTLLLPYMGHSDIYDRLDLNKPWNAPENSFAFNTPIPEYCCPSSEHGKEGSCASQYVVVVGDGAAFEPASTVTFDEITDGMDFTLLVAESTGRSKHWMDPSDLELDSLSPSVNGSPEELSSEHPGGLQVLMGDASVYFVNDTHTSSAIRAAVTRAGGEAHQIGEEDPPTEEELLAREVLDEAIQRGELRRVVELPPPPTPSSVIDGVDLRQLAPRELKDMAEARDSYEIDYSKTIPARYYFVQASGRGRLELALEYFESSDYDSVTYWIQEAIIEEGINPADRYRIRLSAKPFWSPEGKKVAALCTASETFWTTVDHQQSKLYLPTDHAAETPLRLLVLLPPFARGPGFFSDELCQFLVDDLQMAVLSISGTVPFGPDSFSWTEEHERDTARIETAIAKHASEFTEQPGSRIAVGVSNGAIAAFNTAFTKPSRYLGAVSISSNPQTHSVQYGDVERVEEHLRQHYFFVRGELEQGQEMFARVQQRTAIEWGANAENESIPDAMFFDSAFLKMGTISTFPIEAAEQIGLVQKIRMMQAPEAE